MKITGLAATAQPLPLPETTPEEILPRKVETIGRDTGKQTSLDPGDPEYKDKIGKMAGAVENFLQAMGTGLKFRIDEKTDQVQVEVVDTNKDRVIRKIPPDDLIKLAASIEDMVGVFVDKAL